MSRTRAQGRGRRRGGGLRPHFPACTRPRRRLGGALSPPLRREGRARRRSPGGQTRATGAGSGLSCRKGARPWGGRESPRSSGRLDGEGAELGSMGVVRGSSSVGVLRTNLLATCGPRQGQELSPHLLGPRLSQRPGGGPTPYAASRRGGLRRGVGSAGARGPRGGAHLAAAPPPEACSRARRTSGTAGAPASASGPPLGLAPKSAKHFQKVCSSPQARVPGASGRSWLAASAPGSARPLAQPGWVCRGRRRASARERRARARAETHVPPPLSSG